MDFGSAIIAVKQGERIQREGWNGKNQYLEDSKITILFTKLS